MHCENKRDSLRSRSNGCNCLEDQQIMGYKRKENGNEKLCEAIGSNCRIVISTNTIERTFLINSISKCCHTLFGLVSGFT